MFEVFKDASLIIHAGDLTQLSVIRELERLATVVAVQGNMDTPEAKATLPTEKLVQVDSCKIGVVHSLGIFRVKQKMEKMAEGKKLNVLVSGHTHSSSIKWENNLLLINPGQPNQSHASLHNKAHRSLAQDFSGQD